MLLGIKINPKNWINCGCCTSKVIPPKIYLKNKKEKTPKNITPITISTTLKIICCMLLQFLNGFKNETKEELPRQLSQLGLANISIIKTVVTYITEYAYT